MAFSAHRVGLLVFVLALVLGVAAPASAAPKEKSSAQGLALTIKTQVVITSPLSPYKTHSSAIAVAGFVRTAVPLRTVSWSNAAGGQGSVLPSLVGIPGGRPSDWYSWAAQGFGPAQWSVAEVPLADGENLITVRAVDVLGRVATAQVVVHYHVCGPGGECSECAACAECGDCAQCAGGAECAECAGCAESQAK